MRGSLIPVMIMTLALATACQREPSFDEKFAQQSRELTAKARKIEAETNAQLDAAREAEQAAAEMDSSHPAAAPAEASAE